MIVKSHINESFDLEAGFPCAHRNQMLYFHDPTLLWKDIYQSYCDYVPPGGRVLSSNRWREYIKHFFPNLRLHRAESDLCNACYRINIELQDASISDETRAQLLAQQEVHIGKN
jgi:hypothetical protein